MPSSVTQQIENELSTLKPALVRLFLPDGVTRDLPVPKKAGRYAIIAGIMESLAWDHAELMDAENAVVGILNAGPPPGEKPIADEPRDVQLLRILKEAQGMVFTEMRDTFGRALDAYAGIIERVDARLSAMESTYVKMIEREARNVMTTAAKTDEDDEDNPGQRSVADDLMVTVGKALIKKTLGGGGGDDVDMNQVMEIVKHFQGLKKGSSEAATAEPEGEPEGD